MKNGRRFKSGDLGLWSSAAEDDEGVAAEARAARRCFKLKVLGGIVSSSGELRSLLSLALYDSTKSVAK